MWLLQIFFILNISAEQFDTKRAYLLNQFMDAYTAYGPGLGVFTPYWYADISYDNIPFVGKIASGGKEGTSSRLRISPFYPESGNANNPFPPLYRARPLPPHVPEPVDVVAVPLDEEALHGEPLFPKELTLPSEMEFAGEPSNENGGQFRPPFEGVDFVNKQSAWIPEMIETKPKIDKQTIKIKEDENEAVLGKVNQPADPFGAIVSKQEGIATSDPEHSGEKHDPRTSKTEERSSDEWTADSDGHILWRPAEQIRAE